MSGNIWQGARTEPLFMKTSPFFTSEKKEFKYDRRVICYHDNTRCLDGAKIFEQHLQPGTDNRPLCEQCARLNGLGR